MRALITVIWTLATLIASYIVGMILVMLLVLLFSVIGLIGLLPSPGLPYVIGFSFIFSIAFGALAFIHCLRGNLPGTRKRF